MISLTFTHNFVESYTYKIDETIYKCHQVSSPIIFPTTGTQQVPMVLTMDAIKVVQGINEHMSMEVYIYFLVIVVSQTSALLSNLAFLHNPTARNHQIN